MPRRTRTKLSFAERTKLRTLRSRATETRLISIRPESRVDPPPPQVPELVTAAISASAEAVMTMHGSPLGIASASLSFSAESVVTMNGSSAGIETGTFSFSSEASVFMAGAVASSAADFSSTAEAAMAFQGAFGLGPAQGHFSSTAESIVTMVGEDAVNAVANLSVIAESVVTLAGAARTTANFSIGAEASLTMVSAEAALAGVYTEGPASAQQVPPYTAYLTYLDTWENWLGEDVVMVQDLIAYTGGVTTAANWTKINTPTYVYGWGTWKAAQSGREVMLRVPMAPQFVAPDVLPSDLCAQIAAGNFDSHYQTLATNLSANGLGAAHLRIGFRMNASSEPWYAPIGSSNAANFGAAFRRIVDVMEAQVPSNDWKFSIAPEAEAADLGLSWWNQIWPGDSYIHKVGIHVYDQSFLFGPTVPYIDGTMSEATKATRRAQVWDQINGWLLFIRDFATSHGKKISFDEWALVQRTDNHGGGDNPTFVQNVYDFINSPANNVFSQCYVNQNWASSLRCELHPPASNNPTGTTDFPNGAAKYIELFGPQQPPVPPPPASIGVGVFYEGGRPASTRDPPYTTFMNGRQVDVNSDALHNNSVPDSWTFATNPGSIQNWAIWGSWMAGHPSRRFELSLAMCPWKGSVGSSNTNRDYLQEIINGTHDSKFQTLANYLKNTAGLGGTASQPVYISLGKEIGGNWFPWSTRGNNATNIALYKGAWRRIVLVMRAAQPLAVWQFQLTHNTRDLDPNRLGLSFAEAVYPGDDVVDGIGGDLYDNWQGYTVTPTDAQRLQAWNTHHLPALTTQNTHAVAHGKRQHLSEWALLYRQDGLADGGHDDPLFINNVYAWLTSHDFEYANYFDDTSSTFFHSLSVNTQYPNAAAAYKNTFGTLPHPW